MPLDVSHEEFFSLLKKEYSKLQALDGGWLLYKSTEFQNMPKAQCQTCKLHFPLQMLALHVQECMEECLSSEEDIETTSEVEIVSVVHPVQNHKEKSLEEKVPCPICFTPQFLEIHASMCGESDQHVRLDEKTDMGHNNGKAMERQFESVDDVLDTISGRVDEEKRFNIQISRTNILERGLLQWQRQKGSSPTATLNVTFFGEAGVDTGALRKEFLTEVVAGIEGRFFEGPQQQRIPRYSLNDLDSDLYRTVGEILAMSKSMQFVMASIIPQLSDKGTTRHQVELEMMNFIQDFLYEAEDHGHVDKDGLHPITPATFLQWITGQGHVPLLGHHSVCYPVVTACAKTITLPVRHMRPFDILTEAFQLGQEFSNV
ncbi:hypothetical protein CgunFtcFv8_020422 [Champsocephalus gunnari]|uniref:HECT domain-containing protein n=1 Tax=Champsocephalus gunnari TaxID=52237 RepID=A0AAN8E851_CHAGU|nr:hypothetical protein CgunFtcFv8_020422 [Champsocephalus gunnari]